MPFDFAPKTLLVALVVLLAGCNGGLAGDAPATTPTETESNTPTTSTTEVDRDGQAALVTQNISITNHRFDAVVVTVYALRGSVKQINYSYGNGSARTNTRPQGDAGKVWPDVDLGDNVTGDEPVNNTEVARWSAHVTQNETVSLPTVASRQNVSYLIVVYHPAFQQAIHIELFECPNAPWTIIDEIHLQLGGLESDGAGHPTKSAHTSCTG